MALRTGNASDRQGMEHRVNEELSGLITQVTNEIDWLMRENQISRADLAARMGVSPGRVSQVLSGGENLTLRTLAALGAALDAQFELELRPAAAVADGYGATHAVAATAGPAPEPAHFEHADRFGEYSRRN
jgi:transcriptional regulator with XRE-family HTH domain